MKRYPIVDIAVEELDTLRRLMDIGCISKNTFEKKAKEVKDRMFNNFFLVEPTEA